MTTRVCTTCPRTAKEAPCNVTRKSCCSLGESGDGDGAIVEAIVGMARALGMGVIPEGVETEGQLERLAALGCGILVGGRRSIDPAAHRSSAVA